MSNEKHETLADIVREIRQAEVTWHRSEIAQLPTQYLKEWADRIEVAGESKVKAMHEKWHCTNWTEIPQEVRSEIDNLIQEGLDRGGRLHVARRKTGVN